MCKRPFLFPTVVVCALVTFLSTAQTSQAQYIGDRAGWFRGGVIPGGAYYAAYGQAGYGPSFGYLRWGWGWGMRYWFGGWGLSSYWPSVWGGYPNYVSPDWLYSEPYYYSEPNVLYYYPPTQVNLYPGFQSNYATATAPVNAATIQVMVPPNAEMWIRRQKAIATRCGSIVRNRGIAARQDLSPRSSRVVAGGRPTSYENARNPSTSR